MTPDVSESSSDAFNVRITVIVTRKAVKNNNNNIFIFSVN